MQNFPFFLLVLLRLNEHNNFLMTLLGHVMHTMWRIGYIYYWMYIIHSKMWCLSASLFPQARNRRTLSKDLRKMTLFHSRISCLENRIWFCSLVIFCIYKFAILKIFASLSSPLLVCRFARGKSFVPVFFFKSLMLWCRRFSVRCSLFPLFSVCLSVFSVFLILPRTLALSFNKPPIDYRLFFSSSSYLVHLVKR